MPVFRLCVLGTDGASRQRRHDARIYGLGDGDVPCGRRHRAVLANVAVHAPRACSGQGFGNAHWRGRARTGYQPVLLHDGLEHHFARECKHRYHVDAHFRHAAGVLHTQRTDYGDEGRGCRPGLRRCRDTDCHERGGAEREGWRPARRPALPRRSVLVRALPVALQPPRPPLFGHNG